MSNLDIADPLLPTYEAHHIWCIGPHKMQEAICINKQSTQRTSRQVSCVNDEDRNIHISAEKCLFL
jgi:hypothetical protein